METTTPTEVDETPDSTETPTPFRLYLKLAGLALILGLSLFVVSGQAESSDQCIQQYNTCLERCPHSGPDAIYCEAQCQADQAECAGNPPNQGVPPGPGLGEPGCTCSVSCLRIDCIP